MFNTIGKSTDSCKTVTVELQITDAEPMTKLVNKLRLNDWTLTLTPSFGKQNLVELLHKLKFYQILMYLSQIQILTMNSAVYTTCLRIQVILKKQVIKVTLPFMLKNILYLESTTFQAGNSSFHW
ncbi:hypothetical protein T07_6972 [Trichinella nelsoni]|uniref:Uncharacterized protein n=1 Tax=Trichinella nelsoni TaxID=6336 RepID=A0A0V0SJS5_9BILA|nr:hypothetical protein T07_6972 [Trichinella nelsoni]